MKAFAAATVFAGLLLLAGCQAPGPSPAPAPALPRGTIDELVERTRAALPPSWQVNYDAEHQWLEIERTTPLVTDSADGQPTHLTKPAVGLRAVPYLDPATWQKRRAALTKRMLALKRGLDRRTGKDEGSGRYIPATEAEKPRVAEYNLLFDELHALPDYHYHDVGFNLVWRGGSFFGFESVVNDAEREECRRALNAFIGLLTIYEPDYEGQPFQDAARPHGGPQRIPGPVFCAYYDEGDEGVAFHDSDLVNRGSGLLNPADGSYLNEFRRLESLDISYTKPAADASPFNQVTPPAGLLYVGWTVPGEWFCLTVETPAAGDYVADLLYTAQRDGQISITVEGTERSIALPSTAHPDETLPWRQWHHWAVARDAVKLTLPKGRSVLTVHIVAGGNLNLATFLFRPAGTARTGPDIATLRTPVP